jgi:murein DD-endopeptidase MepM/ murein hydrolase activator NlpD
MLAVLLSALLLASPPVAPSPSRAVPALFQPPLAGPIVDHFRAPLCRWCPGNRGIDYGPMPGTPVSAAAAGTVTFAGQVGGRLYVVVAHANGLRTTYADLAAVAVRPAEHVVGGQVVGTSSNHLHFGVRRGDVYLDPEPLLSGARLRARLVPTDGSAPSPPAPPGATDRGRSPAPSR